MLILILFLFYGLTLSRLLSCLNKKTHISLYSYTYTSDKISFLKLILFFWIVDTFWPLITAKTHNLALFLFALLVGNGISLPRLNTSLKLVYCVKSIYENGFLGLPKCVYTLGRCRTNLSKQAFFHLCQKTHIGRHPFRNMAFRIKRYDVFSDVLMWRKVCIPVFFCFPTLTNTQEKKRKKKHNFQACLQQLPVVYVNLPAVTFVSNTSASKRRRLLKTF